MSGRQIECGFIPLVDSAPLVIAKEMGFASAEGLDLILSKEASWSTLRDKLAFGRLDAAHMLAPVPIAMSMGIGGMPLGLDAISILSVNGNVIGVSNALAEKMRDTLDTADFDDATTIGQALIGACEKPLSIGVPFPFSMHAELLYYWLSSLGLQAPQDLNVRSIPPANMADAISAGEIDSFCVGEPWGSVAVERGVAELILPTCAIWRFAPEKVLAVRSGWAERETETATAMMRAVRAAARWLSDPAHKMSAAEILSSAPYLNIPAEITERTMEGRLIVSKTGRERRVDRFIEFFDGAATFPWRSQAVWIASRMAERMGIERDEAVATARACFRADLYRANLGSIGADMPGASEKLEGTLVRRTPVASSTGEMFLGPDFFFDGRTFDPLPPKA